MVLVFAYNIFLKLKSPFSTELYFQHVLSYQLIN